MRATLFALTLIFSLNSFGLDLWIVASKPMTLGEIEQTTDSFRGLIKEGVFTSSYDALLNHPATEEEMQNILNLDSLSRAANLSGRFKEARTLLLKLDNLLTKLPNVAGLEKIRLSTKINLAQVSTVLKTQDSEYLWQNAHAFAPDAILTPEEFSPSVILKFRKPSKIPSRVKLKLKSFEGATIFVDGQKIKESSTVFLEPGSHQIGAIAPSLNWSIKNFEIKSGREVRIRVTPTPFISGDCQNPQLVGQDPPKNVGFFAPFDKNCFKIYAKGRWYSVNKPYFKSSSVEISEDLKPSPSQTIKSEPAKGPSFLSGLIKSPWFWSGLGVALGALIISANQTTLVQTHTSQ